MLSQRPVVTIGMPLFNNAATVAKAISALASQSRTDFALVISDDGSTDETASVCADWAQRDRRIHLVRQPKNLGYLNFRYVLMRSETPFFMWAAGDDWWDSTYLARCLDALESDAKAVCAVSRCRFYSRGSPMQLARGTYALQGDVKENLWRYLSAPRDNTRIYGLFRTAVAQRSFPANAFHAYDWAFAAATLRDGTHIEVPDVLLHRDRTSPDRYVDLVHRDARSSLERVFPCLPMTSWLVRHARIPLDARILGALVELNVEKHREYAEKYLPRYARFADPAFSAWDRRVAWRLVARSPGDA